MVWHSPGFSTNLLLYIYEQLSYGLSADTTLKVHIYIRFYADVNMALYIYLNNNKIKPT